MKRVKKNNLNKNALTNSFRVVGIKIFCFYLVLIFFLYVIKCITKENTDLPSYHVKREQIEF